MYPGARRTFLRRPNPSPPCRRARRFGGYLVWRQPVALKASGSYRAGVLDSIVHLLLHGSASCSERGFGHGQGRCAKGHARRSAIQSELVEVVCSSLWALLGR